MTAPVKALIESSDNIQKLVAAQERAGDLLMPVWVGASDPTPDYSSVVAALPSDMIDAGLALAGRLDKTFGGLPGGPSKGSIIAAARDMVQRGRYPLMAMGAPAWLQADAAALGLYNAIKIEGKALNKAVTDRLRGAAAAEGKALASKLVIWDTAYATLRQVSTLGASALYDTLLPKYRELEKKAQVSAEAAHYYGLCKPVMDSAAAARGQGLLGDLGAMAAVGAALLAALSSVSIWIALGLGVVIGVGGNVLFGGGGKGGVGFFTLVLLAGGGYYAYKKGYLAKIGLKPKGS
jgi:hypothetical protein